MTDSPPPSQFPPGSNPDVVARLQHALEATETARVLVREALGALELHFDQVEAHLRTLISDIKGPTH
jgi:hypothetical protein